LTLFLFDLIALQNSVQVTLKSERSATYCNRLRCYCLFMR